MRMLCIFCWLSPLTSEEKNLQIVAGFPGTVGSASMRMFSKSLSPFTLTFFDRPTGPSNPGSGNTTSSVIPKD